MGLDSLPFGPLSIWRQTVALHNGNLGSVKAAELNTEAAFLKEDRDFTFDNVDLMEEFGRP